MEAAACWGASPNSLKFAFHPQRTGLFRPIADVDAMRQLSPVIEEDYLLPRAADEVDFAPWSAILPATARPLCTNLFGDTFMVDGAGAVHMLERAACSTSQIAASESDFWHRLAHDPEGWQLRPLADECRAAGKVLAQGQCYALTTPPVLGGTYTLENVWVAPWNEWFSFTADLYQQIKDLSPGATVTLSIVD